MRFGTDKLLSAQLVQVAPLTKRITRFKYSDEMEETHQKLVDGNAAIWQMRKPLHVELRKEIELSNEN